MLQIPKTWSFHVVVLQRTARKCTKIYNARAQLLFCSLNLLFDGLFVAVAVLVCLSSLVLNSNGIKHSVFFFSTNATDRRRYKRI